MRIAYATVEMFSGAQQGWEVVDLRSRAPGMTGPALIMISRRSSLKEPFLNLNCHVDHQRFWKVLS